MGDYESRRQEARDIAQEAAEAGVPALHYMLGFGDAPDGHDCDGWVEVDQPVQEVGLVAQPVPCPVCSPRVCPECEQGKHGNCDGTAWNNDIDSVVDCACGC